MKENSNYQGKEYIWRGGVYTRTFISVVFEVLARFGDDGTISAKLFPYVSELCATYGLQNREGKPYSSLGFEELYDSIRKALDGLKRDGSVEHIPPEPGQRAGLWKVLNYLD